MLIKAVLYLKKHVLCYCVEYDRDFSWENLEKKFIIKLMSSMVADGPF